MKYPGKELSLADKPLMNHLQILAKHIVTYKPILHNFIGQFHIMHKVDFLSPPILTRHDEIDTATADSSTLHTAAASSVSISGENAEISPLPSSQQPTIKSQAPAVNQARDRIMREKRKTLIMTMHAYGRTFGQKGFASFLEAVENYNTEGRLDQDWMPKADATADASHTDNKKSSLKDEMIEAIVQYATYDNEGHSYHDTNFHTLYDKVIAYSKSVEAIEECKAEAEQSASSAKRPTFMDLSKNEQALLMLQRPTKELNTLLTGIKSPGVLAHLFKGRGPRETAIENLKKYMQDSRIQDRSNRDHMISELARLLPKIAEEDQEDRENVLALMRTYLVPDADQASLPNAIGEALVHDRPDLILTDKIGIDALVNLMKNGSQLGMKNLVQVLNMALHYYESIKGKVPREQSLKFLGEIITTIANNNTAITKKLASFPAFLKPWLDEIDTVFKKFKADVGEVFGEAEAHLRLVADFFEPSEDLDPQESFNADNRIGFSDFWPLVLECAKPIENMLLHFRDPIRAGDHKQSPADFFKPLTDRLRKLIEGEKNLPQLKENLRARLRHTKEVENELGNILLAINQEGQSIGSNNFMPSLDAYYFLQSGEDQIKAYDDMEKHPELYKDVLSDMEAFDEAWKDATMPDPHPDQTSSEVLQELETNKNTALAYLSGLPELQDKLTALRDGQTDRPTLVLDLLRKEPALRDIWKNRVFALQNERLTALGIREKIPSYAESEKSPPYS